MLENRNQASLTGRIDIDYITRNKYVFVHHLNLIIILAEIRHVLTHMLQVEHKNDIKINQIESIGMHIDYIIRLIN